MKTLYQSYKRNILEILKLWAKYVLNTKIGPFVKDFEK